MMSALSMFIMSGVSPYICTQTLGLHPDDHKTLLENQYAV